MCKFNSRLFVFMVVSLLQFLISSAKPTAKRSLIDMFSYGNDYDIKYDQRQKGSENFRLKLDGFFIGVPAETTGLFLTSEEFIDVLGEELLLGRHGEGQDNKSSQSQTNASDLIQKQVEKYQRAELEKEAEEALLYQKTTHEGRGDSNQGSRTKIYIMNLLDYIRKNRRN